MRKKEESTEPNLFSVQENVRIRWGIEQDGGFV